MSTGSDTDAIMTSVPIMVPVAPSHAATDGPDSGTVSSPLSADDLGDYDTTANITVFARDGNEIRSASGGGVASVGPLSVHVASTFVSHALATVTSSGSAPCGAVPEPCPCLTWWCYRRDWGPASGLSAVVSV